MENPNEYTEENYLKAKKIIADNKNYNKETDLLDRINRFELYKFAKKWIKKYEAHVKEAN